MGKDNISDKELIQRFLNDQLEAIHKENFEARKKDDTFLEALTEAVVVEHGRLSLKKKLIAIGRQEQKNIARKKKMRTLSYVISGIAALLLFGVFFFNDSDSSDLFKNNFKVYPNIYATKGYENGENTLLKEAMILYDEGKYMESIEKFKLLEAKDLKSFAGLYYGVSLLSVDNIETSKKVFKKVLPSDPAYSEAQWYLSLAYLKQDSIAKTETILKTKQHLYGKIKQEQIKELIKKLKTLK